MVEISIIIPTLNEGGYLKKTLKSIFNQDCKDFEIIISDSMSEDNTKEIAEKFGVKLIEGPRRGPGYARNLGAKYAKGEILLFVDADTILSDKDILSTIVKEMEKGNVVGGTSTFETFDGGSFEKFIFSATSNLLKAMYLMNLKFAAPGYFMFVRRDIFQKVGGFDVELPYCEDHDLIKKIKPFGEIILIDKRILASSRRLRNKGLLRTFVDYIPPTIAYSIDKEYMKKKFKFSPSSSINR
ncbi:MAG: glycosyltransferase [Nanoarchaeota archaeon]|nr:glycosyltransferase [Nanoarchaeota archaeon]